MEFFQNSSHQEDRVGDGVFETMDRQNSLKYIDDGACEVVEPLHKADSQDTIDDYGSTYTDPEEIDINMFGDVVRPTTKYPNLEMKKSVSFVDPDSTPKDIRLSRKHEIARTFSLRRSARRSVYEAYAYTIANKNGTPLTISLPIPPETYVVIYMQKLAKYSAYDLPISPKPTDTANYRSAKKDKAKDESQQLVVKLKRSKANRATGTSKATKAFVKMRRIAKNKRPERKGFYGTVKITDQTAMKTDLCCEIYAKDLLYEIRLTYVRDSEVLFTGLVKCLDTKTKTETNYGAVVLKDDFK